MGLIKDVIHIRKSNKKIKDNIEDLAMRKAKDIYFKQTGNKMTPSRLKSDYEGLIVPKATRQYDKNKVIEASLIRRKLKMD